MTTNCVVCQNPLPTSNGRRGRPRKTCSTACAVKRQQEQLEQHHAARRAEAKAKEKEKIPCDVCGTAFVPDHEGHKRCSPACAAKARVKWLEAKKKETTDA